MRLLLPTLLLLLCLQAQAQKKDKFSAQYATTITAEDLKKQLFVIAGPEMEGRETATEGQRKAAAYIEDYFRQLGLSAPVGGAHQQSYNIYSDSISMASLEVNGKKFESRTDFIMNPNNYAFSFKTSEVVFVGYGIMDSTRNDYKDADVRGKVVMMLAGRPGGSFRGFTNKLAFAQQNGAAAVLEIQANFSPMMMGRMGGGAYLDPFRRSIPPIQCFISANVAKAIIGDGYDELTKAAETPGAAKPFNAKLAMELQKGTKTLSSSNVLGYMEGSDLKDEVIVITAHYDHIGKRPDGTINFGADDDGSGTVSVMEIAEAFAKAKKEGKGPRRSILFMTVSGEEKGLWGSRYYSDNPIFPLDKTVCNLNIDMIGRVATEYQKDADSTNYVFVIGDDKLSSELRGISETANATYTKMKLDYKYNDPKDPNRFYYRSDHYNFAEKGVPIIFYFNGTHADYHRPTDTPDKINYPLMAKRAQLVFHTAWEIANRNAGIPRDRHLE